MGTGLYDALGPLPDHFVASVLDVYCAHSSHVHSCRSCRSCRSCWFVLVRVPSNGSCCSCRFVSVRVGSCQFVFVVSIRVALVSIRVARAGLC